MNKAKIVSVYSISHFFTDFVCAIFMLGIISPLCVNYTQLFYCLIIYNFFAFAFQAPLGLLLDKYKSYNYIALLGNLLILLAFLIVPRNPFILSTIVGLGNALFHLEGGVHIYNISDKKAYLNGMFVAPGALGILFGTLLSHTSYNVHNIAIISIIISILLLVLIRNKNTEIKNAAINRLNKNTIIPIILLIGVSIIIRQLAGSLITYEWKSIQAFLVFYTICISIGKFLGGILADKIGFLKTATISLLLSIFLILLGSNHFLIGSLGILLFNIPMAITLTLLENTLYNNRALAVGLNTMFLFLGLLITFIKFPISNYLLIVISITIAILSIYLAIKLYNSKKLYKEDI